MTEVPRPEPDVVLEIADLHTDFATPFSTVHAVDGIDLEVRRGSTVCIVGESGSGKSATARSILQLIEEPGRIVGGKINFREQVGADGIDLLTLTAKGKQMRSVRGKNIAMVFQEPMSSLSPVHTIGDQIIEVLRLHEGLDKRAARLRAIEELRGVGIRDPEHRIDAYTFQLSGGMRQRAMIAMALICRPQILIADEPTTALDVTTQAQILDLLKDLKDRLGMTLIFITHDLGVVAEIADQVAVMRSGKVVEFAEVDDLFHRPVHPYTRALLADLPQRQAAAQAADTGPSQTDLGQPQDDPGRIQVTEPTEAPIDPETTDAAALLDIDELRMHFPGRSAGRRASAEVVKAVDGVSLQVRPGETFGLVGESGCGKTTLGRCILGAYRPTSGRITYRSAESGPGVDLAALNRRQRTPYRGQIRMIFQDPYGSLNPRLSVGKIIAEPLLIMEPELDKGEVRDRVGNILEVVGLQRSHVTRYPHAFSGGERQRIGIARALITHPQLVVADEAVSALDVSVRSHVLSLLAELQQEFGLTYIFVSHDLSVVRNVCDRMAVMYFGRVVELGATAEIYNQPQHGYTRSLLSAVPLADPRLRGTTTRLRYEPDDVLAG